MQRCSKFNVLFGALWTIFCLLMLVVPFAFTEVSNSGGDGTLGRMGDRWWKNYELVEELLQGPDIETLEVDEILVTTRPPPTTPRRTVARQPTPFQIEEVSNTIRHLQTSRTTSRPVPVPVSVTRRTTTTTAAITTTSEESTPFTDHTLPFTSNVDFTAQDGQEEIPKKPHRGRLRLRIRKPSSASPQAAASSEVKIVSSIRPPSSTQPSSFLPARDVRVFHRYSLLDTVKPNVLLTEDQSVSESSRLGDINQYPIPRRRRIRKGKRLNQSTAATTESIGTTDFEVLTTVKRVVKRDTKPLSRIIRQSAAEEKVADIAPMDPEAISTQILSGVSPSRLSPQRANKDPSKPQADGDINTFVAAQILSGVTPTKDAHLRVEASTAEPGNETTTEYPPFAELEAFVAGQILSGASKWMRKRTDAKPAEAVQAQDDVHQQILSGIRPGQSRSTTSEPTTPDSTTASTTELTTTLESVTESARKRFKVRRRTTTTTAAAIPETEETSTVADVPARPRRPLRARSRRGASDSGVWFSDLGPEPAVITDNSDSSNKNKKKMPSEASSVSLESSSGDDPVIKGPSTKQIQESTAVEPDSSGLWFGFMDDVVTTTATASTSKKPSSRSRMGIEVVEAETVSRPEMMASSSAKRSTNVPPIPVMRGQKRRASKNDTARFAALERELNSVMITTEKYPEENDEYLHGTKLASESSDVETTADVNSTSSFRISSSADEQPRQQEPIETTTQQLFRREEEKPRVREETIRLVSDRTKIAQAIAERARRRKGQQRRPVAVADSEAPSEQGVQVEPVEQSPVFEDTVTTTTTTERPVVTSSRPIRISATEILTRPPTPPPPPPPSLEIIETRRSSPTPSPPRVTSTLPPPALPLATPTVKSKKSGSDEIGYFGAEDDLSSSSADSGRGEVAAGEAPSLGALDEASFHDGSSVADQPEQPMAQEEVAGGGEVDHGDDGPLAPEHAGGGESSAWDVVGGPSFNVEVFDDAPKSLVFVNRKNLNGDMRGGRAA